MGKNKEMLKCFIKVMQNDENEIKKIIPNMYQKNFYEIDFAYLKEKNIKNLLIDIDGTILTVDDTFVPVKLKNQFDILKQNNFKICLISNNSTKRVSPVAQNLDVAYLSNANKPKKEAFDKALAILNCTKQATAMIGDQMMSDIKGANEYGLYSILLKPVDNHNNIKTKTSRILQNIMENHLKKTNQFDNQKFYRRR